MPLFQTCSTEIPSPDDNWSISTRIFKLLFHGVGKVLKVPSQVEMERKSKGIVGEMGPEPVSSPSFSYRSSVDAKTARAGWIL